MFSLRPRLKAAADMLDGGRLTVDIGTDHAYLPAYLVINGITEKVLACDIGIKPLENAARTVESYGLEDKVILRVSDGLEKVSPEEAQEISICGMGGTLIEEILKKAEWIKNKDIHLVLQPMTHSEDVRRFLCENGFVIREERYVRDSGRVYCCISADYKNRKNDKKTGYYYFGEIKGDTPEEKEYIEKHINRIVKRADSLREASQSPEEEKILREVIEYYGERYNDNC